MSQVSWLLAGFIAVAAGCAPASLSEVDNGVSSAALTAADQPYPTEPAETIEDVLDQLSAIVAQAKLRGDRAGYFAALYRQVTLGVWRGIQAGTFDDGPRMSRFDAMFGNRYFAALEAWQSGGRPANCWIQAFELAQDDQALILQHILLGVNAHINLDLAFAAAETSPGRDIYALEHDYDLINNILVDALDSVQSAMSSVSPDMELLDRAGGRSDEQVLDFSIRASRASAWQNAVILANTPSRDHAFLEYLLDAQATALGSIVAHPTGLLGEVVAEIRNNEEQDTALVLDRLDRAVDSDAP
jgi:Family of unknown function (DUF5995)